jgi:hypothetical protein
MRPVGALGPTRTARSTAVCLSNTTAREDIRRGGWGTAGSAVAADEKHLYLVNTEGELLRFRRDDSGYVDQTRVGKAVDMTAREGMLYIILETGEIQRRKASDFSLVHSFKVPGQPTWRWRRME